MQLWERLRSRTSLFQIQDGNGEKQLLLNANQSVFQMPDAHREEGHHCQAFNVVIMYAVYLPFKFIKLE